MGLVGDNENGRAAYGDRGAHTGDPMGEEAKAGDVGSAAGTEGSSRTEVDSQGASKEGDELKSMDSKKIEGSEAA